MLRARWTAGLAGVLVAIGAGVLHAEPPKVIEASPDNGDLNVDPSLREITLRFDQAMGKGMSVVGGGDAFPEILGKPRWKTARTFVIRVRLKPNHEYQLSVNSQSHQNFTNRAGEPAEVYPITFRTAAADGGPAKPAGAGSQADANAEAFGLLREAIQQDYSYRDRLGVDWDARFARAEIAMTTADSAEQFARLAVLLLAKAEDKHLWVRLGDKTAPTFVRPVTPNANARLLPELVPNWRQHGRGVATGRWDDGVGYLAIASWDAARGVEQSVFAALDAVADARALVVDVRLNGGGAEPIAQRFAGCFVDAPRLYAKHVYRDADADGGFSEPQERWLQPNAERTRFAGRVAVLTGPVVMSSCEAFLLMMKQAPEAVLVGAPSQGSSGNPQPHDLGNGVTVFVPSWKAMTPDGQEFEGRGIPPDIEVETTPDDFRASDPVLEAALAHLRSP